MFKIVKINPITPIQSGMLFQYVLTNDKSSYMGTERFDFKGNIDAENFRAVLGKISDEYEIFRTNIIYEKLEEPKCVVIDKRKVSFSNHIVNSIEEKRKFTETLIRKQFETGFDIQKDALIRIDVVQTQGESTLIFTFHHILLDGYCATMIADIIMNKYGEKIGRKVTGEMKYVPFSEYQKWLVNQNINKSKEYWNSILTDVSNCHKLEIVQFENDKLKDKGYSFLNFEFTKEETDKLIKISAENHTTLNIYLQWLWGLTLCRNHSAEKTVFGTVASFRPVEIENSDKILGPMINTIPVVFDDNESESIKEQLQKFSRTFANSLNNSWIGLGEIQKSIKDCGNLINHLFVYDNFPEMDFSCIEKNTGFKVIDFNLEERTEYALTLEISKADNIKIRFNYDSSIYSGESIERLAKLYKNICVNSVDAEYPYEIMNISKAEENKLSLEKKQVSEKFKHISVTEKFAEIVKQYGENKALEYKKNIFTYNELDDISNKLAWKLKNMGYSENSRIAMDITPSVEAIISMLAILKLGGCYIPFDMLMPKKRLENIIEDAEPDIILVFGDNDASMFDIPNMKIVSDELNDIVIPDDALYKAGRNENSISNIMFTSGTTSKPKGVVLRDGGILGLVIANGFIDYDMVTCQFQNSSIAFDASTYEIWGALLNGKRLVIVDKNTLLATDEFEKLIKDNQGCSIFLTTTLFNNFVDKNANMFRYATYVATGGEKFSEAHGRKFMDKCDGVRLLNGYGPTESSVFTTCFEITPESLENTVPIGRPINTRGVIICDNNTVPLPDGSVGEIIIYGQGLAEGYCGDKEITAKKFITFSDGTRAYKSGDYGYRDSEGYIHFCARFDNQLKLRGFRISTDEIETALRDCGDIENAAVAAFRNSKNGMFLAAYVVTKNNVNLKEIQSRITDELGAILPYYMIPSEFIQMTSIPVNSNGKLDKSKLEMPEYHGEDIVYPETETEKKIFKIFKDVITDCDFGIEHSFIKIGGDSIKAMKLIAIAEKNGYNITVADLYREQTPSRLAAFIDYHDIGNSKTVKDITPDFDNRYEEFPLNNVQIAYLSGRSKELVLGGYGTAFFSETQGNYDCKKLNDTINILIKRHDMLRAVIYTSGVQQILPPDKVKYDIQEKDISDMTVSEQNEYLKKRYGELRNIVFETGRWPMFSVETVRTSENNVHILYVFDALIMDAFSVIMLAGELERLYNGEKVGEELQLSFRDYILEVRNRTDEYEKDKKYWLEKAEAFPDAPALKFKTPPEELHIPDFKRKHICFNSDVWNNIRELSMKLNITPAILLCGLYSYTLSLYSGQSELAVNLTVFSREQIHSQIDKILGDFTKIVLLDYNFSCGKDFKDILSESHTKLNDYLTHLHFDGIDFMRQLARIHKPVNGRPLMPVVFTSALFDSDIVYDCDKASSRTPQVYLDCQAMLQKGELHIVWDYPDGLFEDKMLDNMFECFTEFISCAGDILKKPFLINSSTAKFYNEYNSTAWEHKNITLQQLVKDSIYNTDYKDNIWIYSENSQYTYEQTRNEVLKYASYLQSKGIKCGDFVCVEGERTPETLFMILAVVLCGGAYIPVQPSWPKDRKEDIKLLSQCRYWFNAGEKIENGNFEYKDTDKKAPAYVIYTSGSTGKPKGVLINQSAVTNTILDINERYKISENDVFAAVSSFSFDLSVYDIFGSLSAGAGLSLIKEMKNINAVISQLEQDKVTVWNTVPALMELLTSELEHKSQNDMAYNIPIRLVLLSGDWIPVKLPSSIRQYFKNSEIVSLGGATEASVWSIAYDIEKDKDFKVHIPYGYPLRNQTMYILNDVLQPLPIGVTGDIYIGGAGVADGYQNNKEQTKSAFIEHSEYGRIYRTGDTGYISDEGCMEFCGRKDFQVKVNGLRIELGDIDSTVRKIDGISNSISTVIKNGTGSEFLCTYVQRVQNDSKKKEIINLPFEYMNIYEEKIISSFDIENYKNISELLEKFCIACMAEALIKMGIERVSGKQIDKAEIPVILNIAENRYINFRQWFNALCSNGIIEYNEGVFSFFAEKAENPDKFYNILLEKGIPDYLTTIIEFVIKVRGKLPEIMYGQVNPMSEIFFEGGSIENGINIYRNSITGQVYGFIAAELTAVLAESKQNKPFRILEVGAGVGGTTDYIIDKIKKIPNVTYTYTDLSNVFLDEAQKRYKDCDFIDYKIYDINKHPQIQQIPLHSFDLVIGANVFHDAHNIESVIDNSHLLLADNGKLMIIEATVNTAAQMITASFVEGLTKYEDDRLKTDLPAYSEEQWRNSIEKYGYTESIMFPQNKYARNVLQTSLILTESCQNGITVNEDDILEKLRKKLPDYMIPKFIVEVQKFPLTDNGKVDVKKLPEMNIDMRKRSASEKPQTELEKKLTELWKENLDITDIGTTDNYFAMGGDSLKAIRLMSRIEESGYKININSIFRCTTIKAMAEEIEKK